MMVNDLEKIDSHFNEDDFITRSNHMIKKIYNSISLDELSKVRHFISDEIFNKIQKEIDGNKEKNMRLIFDEVNVNSSIEDIEEIDNSYLITVSCSCKYLKYYLSLDSGKKVNGDDNTRIWATKTVVFEKHKNAIPRDSYKCFGCGYSLNVNESGKCPMCGRIFNLEDYDYVIKEFDIYEEE